MILSRLKNALHTLSPRQRVIFDLRHSQHQEIKDIAVSLKCSERPVKTQLSRATAKLRTRLERYSDTLKAPLTGFVNRSDINQPDEFLSIEKQLIKDMLIAEGEQISIPLDRLQDYQVKKN